MKKEKISKRIYKALGTYMNRTMQVKYMVIWCCILIMVCLTGMLIHTQKVSVFVWWTADEGGRSNWCYEDNGKYCLVPKKVNQFEKTREEYK